LDRTVAGADTARGEMVRGAVVEEIEAQEVAGLCDDDPWSCAPTVGTVSHFTSIGAFEDVLRGADGLVPSRPVARDAREARG
jgi:hypothetical protein